MKELHQHVLMFDKGMVQFVCLFVCFCFFTWYVLPIPWNDLDCFYNYQKKKSNLSNLEDEFYAITHFI